MGPVLPVSPLDGAFTKEELDRVLKTVKDNKAPGIDGVPFEFYRYAGPEFGTAMLDFFNNIWLTDCVTDSFKESIIFPLHKKGDATDPVNFRGGCHL